MLCSPTLNNFAFRTPHGLTKNNGIHFCPVCGSAGHHLLNVLLIPILKASAPSRIICTSSCFHDHANGKEGVIAYDDLHFKSRKYDPWTSYAQSSKNPSDKAHSHCFPRLAVMRKLLSACARALQHDLCTSLLLGHHLKKLLAKCEYPAIKVGVGRACAVGRAAQARPSRRSTSPQSCRTFCWPIRVLTLPSTSTRACKRSRGRAAQQGAPGHWCNGRSPPPGVGRL
jgi:hypothetical protein